VARLPGFPASSYLDFAIAFCFMQAALFAMTGAGTVLAADVQTGFLRRLALTRVHRVGLILGYLSGVLGVSLLAGLTYLAVGFVAGIEVKAGPGGVAVLLALALLIATAFGLLGAFAGLRAGHGQASRASSRCSSSCSSSRRSCSPGTSSSTTGSARSRRTTRCPTSSRGCAP
jgi:ABC-2 type transport system permease protein